MINRPSSVYEASWSKMVHLRKVSSKCKYKTNENSLKSLYLDISDYFKDCSSKLNYHSAMTVGKFILAQGGEGDETQKFADSVFTPAIV